MKIPGGERAILDAAKVRDYLLSREHRVGAAKARFFTKLGFDHQHWSTLRDELLRLAQSDAELGSATRFGQKMSCGVRSLGRPGGRLRSWSLGLSSQVRTVRAS